MLFAVFGSRIPNKVTNLQALAGQAAGEWASSQAETASV